jgi:hypothetical protein
MLNEEKIEIEIEEEKESEYIGNDGHVTNPFSTKDIKITNVVLSLSSLIAMLEHNEIDLNPDFQRHPDLWNRKQMSSLIESILLKLPLPIFYFDVSDPEKWIVVDGLQRLSTIQKFIIDDIEEDENGNEKRKGFALTNLEYLDLNGKTYSDLKRPLQRIINDTQIITHQIEAQTPKEVRYSLFKRINTGGVSLNTQEIRQALNRKASKFLQELSEDEIFQKIVGLSSKRMRDRELALRFMVFELSIFKKTKLTKMVKYLDVAMEKLDLIDDEEKLQDIKDKFINTLKFTVEILGENHKFSRSIAKGIDKKTLNQSLFDVIMVCFSEIEDKELFLKRKNIFLEQFKSLIENEKGEFAKAITEGTSDRLVIETRFRIMRNLIKEVLDGN